MRRLFIVLVAICLNVDAAAALTIRGDRHWVEDPHCPEGWRLLDFDDSSWSPVPYPWTRMWPREWPLDSDARPIWGTAVRHLNCLRRTFDLAALPSDPAVANIWVDDDYDLFVNGIPVGSSTDHMGDMPGETYDITPLLRLGRNVIAIRVLDNGGGMATLVSIQIPEVPDLVPDFRERLVSIQPWLTFAGVILTVAAWIFGVRRLTRQASAWSPALTLVLTLLLAVSCQAVFATATFYQSHREMPLAVWYWLPIATIALLLAALAMVRGRSIALEPTHSPVRHEGWWLVAILLLATLLRVYRLDSVPPGFFQDEATNGNDALAVTELGHLAIWSDSIGGRPTMFLYILSYALQMFGVSYLKLKIVPVVFGIAGVAAVYAVGRLTLGARAALWAAFLLAVARWDIHYSRMAWEAICVPFFAATGFALLIDGMRDGRRAPLSLLGAAAVLSAGLYTYAAYRAVPAVALVFLAATLISTDRRVLARRWPSLAIAGIVGIGIAAPLAHFAWEQPDLYWYRYSEVSLTGYMDYYRTPTPWLHQLGKGLLSLTSVGDELVRHNLPWAAHLDQITGGLMLIGMATALAIRRTPCSLQPLPQPQPSEGRMKAEGWGRGWRLQESHIPRMGLRLVWCWFLTFMALATLTMDGPHATRLLGAAPAAVLFAGFGMACLLREVEKAWRPPVAVATAGAAALAITVLNAHQYFVLHANHPAADFEYDVTGKSLCEYLRNLPVPVELHRTDDIAYWSDGQCLFLARGKYALAPPVQLKDLFRGNRYESEQHPSVFVIGQEFVDRNRASLAFDEHGVPKLGLPGEPLIARDRSDRILYYLYTIALPPRRETG